MSNEVKVDISNRNISLSPSSNFKIHDLTMLFLKDKTFKDVKELAKIYTDTSNSLNEELNQYRKSLK